MISLIMRWECLHNLGCYLLAFLSLEILHNKICQTDDVNRRSPRRPEWSISSNETLRVLQIPIGNACFTGGSAVSMASRGPRHGKSALVYPYLSLAYTNTRHSQFNSWLDRSDVNLSVMPRPWRVQVQSELSFIRRGGSGNRSLTPPGSLDVLPLPLFYSEHFSLEKRH